MKLAMRVGKGRHYRVSDIVGRHFVETGLEAGFSREQIAAIFEDIVHQADRALSVALKEMPSDFPAPLVDSIERSIPRRIALLTDRGE